MASRQAWVSSLKAASTKSNSDVQSELKTLRNTRRISAAKEVKKATDAVQADDSSSFLVRPKGFRKRLGADALKGELTALTRQRPCRPDGIAPSLAVLDDLPAR